MLCSWFGFHLCLSPMQNPYFTHANTNFWHKYIASFQNTMFFKRLLNPCQARTLPVQARAVLFLRVPWGPAFAFFAAIFQQFHMIICKQTSHRNYWWVMSAIHPPILACAAGNVSGAPFWELHWGPSSVQPTAGLIPGPKRTNWGTKEHAQKHELAHTKLARGNPPKDTNWSTQNGTKEHATKRKRAPKNRHKGVHQEARTGAHKMAQSERHTTRTGARKMARGNPPKTTT